MSGLCPGRSRRHQSTDSADTRAGLYSKLYYSNCKVSRDLLELRNLATVSELVIRCAMQRKESRGLHYTLDYPDLSPIARDTVMVPINFAGQDVIIHRDQV